MSELTVSQQTPPSPPGGAEMSKCDRAALQWYVHIQMHFLLSAGPPPPPSTISDHPSSPPPSLEPAVDQEVTSSPPHLHSGNIRLSCIYIDC